jgi:non-ribosomal peptide synthase protein (TIGR01720 family)
LLHELVAGRPADTAVIHEGGELTYGDLDAWAERVAGRLRDLGVRAGTVVGLRMKRGPELVAGLLGVWKAGGACLPLDPRHPEPYNATLIAAGSVRVVLDAEDAIEVRGDVPPPDRLSWIAAVPGPAAVQLDGRGPADRLGWLRDRRRPEPGERILSTAPVTHPAALYELLWPLASGGRLVLAAPGREHDIDYLTGLIEDERVGVAQFTAPTFRRLAEQEWVAPMRGLRLVLCHGDGLSGDDVARFHMRHETAVVESLHGPAELSAGNVSVHWPRSGGGPQVSQLPGVQMYVLDEALSSAVEGELYLGGGGLARGYAGRPGLTAERFVADPRAGDGTRLYRTGDVVRRTADGLEFTGRLDRRLTVRGFRVDPAEIEAVLLAHPAVTQAEVSLNDDRLTARLSPPEGLPPDHELLAFLRQRLPDHMVPAAFGAAPVRRQAEYVAPRTPTEDLLATAFTAVLGLERVGAADNFFELGGDSIMSAQVVSRVREAGFELVSADVFEHQTVAELAAFLGQTAGRPADFPLAPAQEEFVGPHTRSVRLAIRRPINLGHLRTALAAVIDHHDALRLRLAGGRQHYGTDSPDPWSAAQLNLEHGPLLRAVPDGPDGLVLTAHRFAVDEVSWRILLEDLGTACDQAEQGRPIALGPKTAAYRQWCERLAEPADLTNEADFWRSVTSARLPRDHPDGPPEPPRTLHTSLPVGQTDRLLRQAPDAYGTEPTEMLLTPLVECLTEWARHAVAIDVKTPGRLGTGLDLSRTVGCFATTFPVSPPSRVGEPGEALKQTKEYLRRIPRHGLGYGLLRQLTADGLPAAEAGFRFSEAFTTQRFQPTVIPGASASHLIELDCHIATGALEMTWTYASPVLADATVERLARRYTELLTILIDHCCSPGSGGYTPSDFPLAQLDQSTLDRIQQRVGSPFGGRS